jgi:hypothetical protein
MLKRKLATMIATGVLFTAGAVHASVFPSSANEIPASLYADSIQRVTIQAKTGAMQPVFPSGALEHGGARDARADVQSTRTIPSLAGSTSKAYPSSVNETGAVR